MSCSSSNILHYHSITHHVHHLKMKSFFSLKNPRTMTSRTYVCTGKSERAAYSHCLFTQKKLLTQNTKLDRNSNHCYCFFGAWLVVGWLVGRNWKMWENKFCFLARKLSRGWYNFFFSSRFSRLNAETVGIKKKRKYLENYKLFTKNV